MLRLGPWRVRLAEPSLRAALEPALEALARGEDPPHAERVKRTRTREVFQLALAAGGAAYLKREFLAGMRWRRSGAAREYENLLRLRSAGFAAVEPLALAERGGTARGAVLVTRALPDAVPLSAALRGASAAHSLALLTQAAGLARRLHEARLWHRDFHAGNLLLQGDRLWLVDLQKLRNLPFPVPLALRARDLVWLVNDGRLASAAPARAIAEAYALAAPGGPDPARFTARVARAAARAARTRLRSRGRRCVVPSTGFRNERRGPLHVWRRADVTTSAAIAAAGAARPGDWKKLDEFVGGPPPGPAPDPFARGQGAPEPGTPARAPGWARGFGGGLGVSTPIAFGHPGLRAWRLAHALLLRGVETPAPLALIESRRLGFVSHSVLVTRRTDDTLELTVALAGEPGRAHSAGVELARWHGRGIEAAPLGLRFSVAGLHLVATLPEHARLRAPLARARAERDVSRITEGLGPAEHRALVDGYRTVAAS